jgi:hypothetical protein
MISPVYRFLIVALAACFIGGPLACARDSGGTHSYQARRDEFRRTLIARDKRGENVSAADDSALRELETLLRPIVGEFTVPWTQGPGNINLQTLLPGDMNSGLPDGMLYQSRDSATRVLVTTHDLMQSWIARFFDKDSTISREPTTALRDPTVLTQIFDVDAAVSPYSEILIDSASALGVVSAKLVTRAQDYCLCAADEIMVTVARGSRIFVIDAPAHDTIPIPPSCLALADSGAATDSTFRRCYGTRVVHEPRFRRIVAQVQSLVESLPVR